MLRTKNLPITLIYILYCFSLAFYFGLSTQFEKTWGLWGVAIGQGVIFALIPFLFVKLFSTTSLRYVFPLTKPRYQDLLLVILLSALVIVLANFVLNLQNQYWPLPKPEVQYYQNLIRHKNWFVLSKKLLLLAFVPAFCEEIFFRGLIQFSLAKRFSNMVTIGLSGLLFAIAHFDIYYFGYFLLLGIFFAYLRHYYRSVTHPMLAHLLNNLYSLI
ncbi:MAG: CPBP family intramembrane metalloprotease [Deltaproteobacteria bacterium]|nr:CPBP family intramembrane metalloprotease [Deltaproteobacteria bacterium]